MVGSAAPTGPVGRHDGRVAQLQHCEVLQVGIAALGRRGAGQRSKVTHPHVHGQTHVGFRNAASCSEESSDSRRLHQMLDCVSVCVYSVHSHDVHGHGGGQALAYVFEEVVGGEELRAAGDEVLLQLQQLRAATQKHLDTQRGRQ